jgi:hypothetical protein
MANYREYRKDKTKLAEVSLANNKYDVESPHVPNKTYAGSLHNA